MHKKLINIQALRGVAALLVLVAHLQGHSAQSKLESSPSQSFWNVGHAGVDMFFVISGFVMATATAGGFAKKGASLRFLQRRAFRIYPLYWLFTLIVLPIYLFKPHMIHTVSRTEHVSILRAFILFPQWAAPLVAQGWTLIHEMYFYIVFAALLMFREKFLPWALMLWTIAIVANGVYFDFRHVTMPSSSVYKLISNPMTLEFILGCVLAMATARRTPPLGLLVLIVGGVLLALNGTRTMDLHAPWMRIILFGIPAGLIVLGAIAIERNGVNAPLWLQHIGDASYSIYLSQGLVYASIAKIVHHLFPQIHQMGIPLLLCLAASGIVGGLLCYRFVETPLINLTRKFTSSKPKGPEIATVKNADSLSHYKTSIDTTTNRQRAQQPVI